MKISKEEIEHIATLARLKLTEEEIKLFSSQLSSILDYVEQLNKLDTKDIEPASHVISLYNVMREDQQGKSLTVEEALRNSPSHTDKFYRVPKIIE